MADRVRWVPPPLPDDPQEVLKIRRQLIILALLGVVPMVISKIVAD